MTLPTWEHSEYGSEGVELEAVDDVAKVTHLDGHEDAPGGQQEDIQALRNNAQPQHSYGENQLWQRNNKEAEKKTHILYAVGVEENTAEWMMGGCRNWERRGMGGWGIDKVYG